MALESVPWFVGGGAEHSPDVARMVAYAATNGAGGVLGSLDFRVTPLPTPGTSVRVAAGGGVIPNGYLAAPDFGKQSYVARAASVTDVPITATGSGSARSDFVVLRLDDPQFGGQIPVDVVNGPYVRFAVITNVGSTATTLPALSYPALLLARIDLPPSTGTVQESHIVDLRKIANPRRTRELYNTQPTAISTIATNAWTDWTPQANRTLTIPSWATQMKVLGHISSVAPASAATLGVLRFAFGTLFGQQITFDLDASTRATLLTADTLAIPAAMRNTNAILKLQAARSSGTGNVKTDTASTVVWDVEFLEVPSVD